MWSRTLFGFDSYHVILWFLTYSILGWAVESFYMSICNRKLTNRGFSRGPICPIYGVGALTVFILLRPYSHNKILLFIMGSFLATLIEYITALLMNRLFGEIWWDYKDKPFNYKGILCLESSIAWWDYKDKPFNYKGILCLESSIAWGVYTVILFVFLQGFVEGIVNRIPFAIGRILGSLIIFAVVIDYIIVLRHEMKERRFKEE
ncbi:putative ABC transporter permease [Lachnospiraceae bacterium EP-SM-12S-S03]|nr:putative ABC transporter permease [Lachnospiraceae bacterium EP-SM-12S-S03]